MHKSIDWTGYVQKDHWICVYGMVYAQRYHASEGGGDLDFAGEFSERTEPDYGFMPEFEETRNAAHWYTGHPGLAMYGQHGVDDISLECLGSGEGHGNSSELPDHLRPGYEHACRAMTAGVPECEIALEELADPMLQRYSSYPVEFRDWEYMFT